MTEHITPKPYFNPGSMANYILEIRDHNIMAHWDLEEEVKAKNNGLLTFTIRVDGGNIVDFNITEYVDVKRKYGIIKALVIEEIRIELTTPLNSGKGS